MTDWCFGDKVASESCGLAAGVVSLDRMATARHIVVLTPRNATWFGMYIVFFFCLFISAKHRLWYPDPIVIGLRVFFFT